MPNSVQLEREFVGYAVDDFSILSFHWIFYSGMIVVIGKQNQQHRCLSGYLHFDFSLCAVHPPHLLHIHPPPASAIAPPIGKADQSFQGGGAVIYRANS